MQFLLLICLMTVFLPLDWPEPPLGIGVVGSLTFTGMLVSLLLLVAGIIARSTMLRLIDDPDARDALAHRYAAARTYFFFANLTGFAIALLGLGWGWSMRQLAQVEFNDRSIFIPGGELLLLAPFLLTQIGSWCFFYDADREFHELFAERRQRGQFWSRPGYVLFLLRQQFILVLAPLILPLGYQGLQRLYPQLLQSEGMLFVSLLILPGFLVFFPLFLPTLLGLKPLPPGPLRSRLEANARRLRFQYSQIYLWDTRGGVANAMIVGVVPWIRYVIFTDRLLGDLSDDEIDAVFGHELGHAKHGHMLYYVLFLMLSVMVMGALIQSGKFFDESGWRQFRTLFLVTPIVTMGAYMFAAFGFISRRCERQADIFGCRAVSCGTHGCAGHDAATVYPASGTGLCQTGIAAFIRALQRVDDINGLTKENPRWRGKGLLGKLNWIFRQLTDWLHTWQHSTISKRIVFLERIAKDPEVERRFQLRLFVLKWVIVLGLFGTLVGLGLWKGWEVLLAT